MAQDAASWITLEKDRASPYAKINMCREPVNGMNYAFWKRMMDVLNTCEQSSDIRGVIFYRSAPAPAALAHWHAACCPYDYRTSLPPCQPAANASCARAIHTA